MTKPQRWISLAAVLCAICGLQVRRASAEDVQLNTYTTGPQSSSSVAQSANGDFVVVWTSAGSSGTDSTGYSIQARRFAADDSPVGAQFQVNSYTTSGQYRSAVAMDAAGNFVVVWDSYGSAGTDTLLDSIQAQRYAADGSPLGDQFQVNTYTLWEQYGPSVASSAAGDFVVVWNSYIYDYYSPTQEVKGQRFAADGSPMGGEFQVNTYTTRTQAGPAVASNAAGEFVVVWHSFGSSGTDSSSASVQGQRYAAAGSPLAGEFQINTYTPGSQWQPSVASNADGDFVVVWESRGSSGSDSSGYSIRGRRFTADGLPVGNDFQINTYTTNDQRFPSVALDAAGNFAVTWQSAGSHGTDLSDLSIQGRLYAADGSPIGDEFQVNSYTISYQRRPSVALASTGEMIMVWTSAGSAGTDTSGTSIQRTPGPSIFADGFESGDTTAWSKR